MSRSAEIEKRPLIPEASELSHGNLVRMDRLLTKSLRLSISRSVGWQPTFWFSRPFGWQRHWQRTFWLAADLLVGSGIGNRPPGWQPTFWLAAAVAKAANLASRKVGRACHHSIAIPI
jgi:hypothetical protein